VACFLRCCAAAAAPAAGDDVAKAIALITARANLGRVVLRTT
jgi:hypothetical protein